jgi:hypothetical protein
MSAEDAADGKEPVEHDGFDEDLAQFLSDDWRPTCEEDDDSSFEVSDFLAELYDVEGVFMLPAAVEVPLAAFHEAQQADALHNLEIVIDRHGGTYLVGIAGSEGDQIVLVSVSLAPVETGDDSIGDA